MTYDKTIYMIMFLISLKRIEISYSFNINKFHGREDTPRHISVKIHLSTVFYKSTVCFKAFAKFPRHLEKVFHAQIFLPTWLVKIYSNPKVFKKHRQACSISSLSSIVKMRLTMIIESSIMNILYIDYDFHELKTSLKELIQRKFMQRIQVVQKNE